MPVVSLKNVSLLLKGLLPEGVSLLKVILDLGLGRCDWFFLRARIRREGLVAHREGIEHLGEFQFLDYII